MSVNRNYVSRKVVSQSDSILSHRSGAPNVLMPLSPDHSGSCPSTDIKKRHQIKIVISSADAIEMVPLIKTLATMEGVRDKP